MADLGRLLKPASLVRIALLYLVVMALYATSARAQDEGVTNWLTVVVGMSAVMTVATVAVIFALQVASRGGVAAWQAGRLGAAGQQGDALARYNQALARNPNGAEALAGRAELLAATGDTAAALADLDRAITVTPHVSNFPDPVLYRAYLARGRLRESRGDLAGALADWAQAGRVSPGAPDPYVLRGRAAAESGDPVRARTELTTGVQLLGRALERVSEPGQRGALLNMRGLAFNLLGEYQRALADLEQSLQIEPDSWITHYNLGATYVHLGHIEPALAELKQALRLNPAAAAQARASRGYAPLRDNPDFRALVGD
jgi:tetratricopeptide (TPR) repeat protein